MNIIRVISFPTLLFTFITCSAKCQCEFTALDTLNLSPVFRKYDLIEDNVFYNGSSELDVVILSTFGGSNKIDYLKISKIDSLLFKVHTSDTTYYVRTNLNTKRLVKRGTYIGLCPYSSSNSSYAIIVHVKNQLYFKAHWIGGKGIEALPFQEYKDLVVKINKIVGSKEFNP